MAKLILVLVTVLVFNLGNSQLAPNFDLTDSEGNHQRLYEDYLDQGKVVMLKIFFVNCPPCNAIASAVQAKYVAWGSGNNNVAFIEISNKLTDNNTLITNYKNQHGITFPSIGGDGGGYIAAQPYMSNMFGQWYGTPALIVIAPDKTVNFNVDLDELDQAIGAAIPSQPSPRFNLSTTFQNGQIPQNVSIILHASGTSQPAYDIGLLTDNTYSFLYPSEDFPILEDPVISLVSNAAAKSNLLNVGDLIAIRNHIVGLTKFTKEQDLISGDVNGDNKINVSDLIILQKVIANILTSFPNGVPSYRLYPEQLPLEIPQNGQTTVEVNLEILKTGNVK